MTTYLDFKNNIEEENLKEVANAIKNGKIAIFPTETVYGIGTNGFNSDSVKRIYEIKGRNFKNPINLLVSTIQMVEAVANNITYLDYKLMEAFFPGPFTLILEKNAKVPNEVTAGNTTVGVRMPSNEIARKLVEYAGVPIATPSANISGKPSATCLKDIIEDFSDKVDFMIDGGNTNLGIESTIVRVIDGIPHILRPGSITAEQIRKIAGNVIIENKNLPSSNLKHYQINSKAVMVYSKNTKKMIDKIISIANDTNNPIILSFSEDIHYYPPSFNVIDIGSKNNLKDVSKNLFTNLRKAEITSPSLIILEGTAEDGLGLAIKNRLLNVCNNNYIEI